MFDFSEKTEDLQRGHVKWFDVAKGYGFITPEEGEKDVFFHYSALSIKGFKTIDQGQLVEYTTQKTDSGIKADKVKIALL
jgi:cold shock CspA family protein